MSDIDLIRRATIDFPTPLRETDFEDSLIVLAEREGCRVNYTLVRTFEYDPKEGRRGEKLQKTGGEISTSGGDNGFASLRFDLIADYLGVKIGKRPDRMIEAGHQEFYTRMRFFTAPGYSEGDIAPIELKLMDRVRDYFCTRFGWKREETIPKDSDL